MKRLSAPFRALARALHEREIIRAEQAVLSFLMARRPNLERLRDLEESNQRRLAELERDPATRLAAGARTLLHRLPGALRAPISALARGLSAAPRRGGPGAGAGPAGDQAAAAPFGPAFPQPRLISPVAAAVHVYYAELAAEMREYLAHIPGRVDVYLSTDTDQKRDRIAHAFAGWTAGTVDVRLTPNRGRDVAPKLIAFRDLYDRYPIVLQLHSKKSPHDSDLRMWRDYLYETLIGDEATAASVLAAFEQRPDLGLIAPQHYFAVRNGIGWNNNLEGALGVSRRMGFELDADAPLDFPAGSMFWVRSAALRPLLDLALSVEDFEPEAGQEDGTLAHAIERLYFHACELAGYRWIKIGRPELATASAGPATPIGDPADLASLIEATPPLRKSLPDVRPTALGGLPPGRAKSPHHRR